MGARGPATTWLAVLRIGALLCASCSAPARPAWSPASASDWPALTQRLAEERDARPRNPWAAVVHVTLREPRTGHLVDGRGAIAVAPGRAVRVVLVGGAGLTLLDAWIATDKWRIAVPPAQVIRRGGASEDPVDLPVGFLRWWFFTPLEGTLFAGARSDTGTLWLLHAGDAVVELVRASGPDGGVLTVTRRSHGRSEVVRERRAAILHAGDWVEYKDEASGLAIRLVVESVADGPPQEDAFRDPDAQGGT
jgi:hypothetical protein